MIRLVVGPLVAVGLPSTAALLFLRGARGMNGFPGAATFRASLAILLGIGAPSLLFFAWLAAGGRCDGTYLAVDAACSVVATGAGLVIAGRHRPATIVGARPPVTWIAVVAGAVAVAAVVTFALMAWSLPHGDWDAWAIWNGRARVLFRSVEPGGGLRLPMPNSEYPLLLTGTVVRTWAYAGVETTWGPTLVEALFALATSAALASALARSSGTLWAVAGASMLLSSTTFFVAATSQYADVPVGAYFLATIALLALAAEERGGISVAWAGFAAGLGGWTKNDGLLYLVAAVVALAWHGLRVRGGAVRRVATFLGGAAIPLAVIVAHKIVNARAGGGGSWLTARAATTPIERLLDPARHVVVAREFSRHLLHFGRGAPFVLAIVVALAWAQRRRARGRSWACVAIAFAASGVYGVFVLTPLALEWQLQTALDRVLVQLWPALVFVTLYAAVGRPSAQGTAQTDGMGQVEAEREPAA